MTKIEKNAIINIIIGAFLSAFLSAFFTWMFNILTESFNPIIILYTILSTLGVLILFHGIEKILIKVYKKGGYWLEINNYNKKVNQNANAFKNILIEKEIFIVDIMELARYFDPKIQFYKPSRASIEVFNIRAVKKSTIAVIDRMINNGILIYIESNKLLLLKEKMICIKCGGEILFHDKINYVKVKCQKCSEEYRITSDGLWHVNNEKDRSGHELYIRIKHLDRLRF